MDAFLVLILLSEWFRCVRFALACDEHEHDHHHHTVSYLRSNHDETPIENHRHLQDGVVEECGVREPSLQQREEDIENMRRWKELRQFERNREVVSHTVSVYVHVIKPSESYELVSDARVAQYMSYLNSAYTGSGAPFTFEHRGTTRTINSQWSNNCYSESVTKAMTGSLKVGGKSTLNIYLCNQIINGAGYPLAGYAYVPFKGIENFVQDGVVLSESTSDQRLNTCVHEVGHWLGLYHTFRGNTCGNSEGDLVDDTPQHLQRSSTVNCHTDPSTWDTCPGSVGKDPVDNYMIYSTDNFCRTRFTSGQIERMQAQYELYRHDGTFPAVPPSLPPPVTTPTSPNAVPTISTIPSTAPPPTPSTPMAFLPPTGPLPAPVAPFTPTTVSTPTAPSPTPTSCGGKFLSSCQEDQECCSTRCGVLFGLLPNRCSLINY